MKGLKRKQPRLAKKLFFASLKHRVILAVYIVANNRLS